MLQTSTISSRSHASAIGARRAGLVSAALFARVPLACAAIIAVASADARGRYLAIAIGVATVVAGLAMHASAIVLGRVGDRAPARAATNSESAQDGTVYIAGLRHNEYIPFSPMGICAPVLVPYGGQPGAPVLDTARLRRATAAAMRALLGRRRATAGVPR